MSYSRSKGKSSVVFKTFDLQCKQRNIQMLKEYNSLMRLNCLSSIPRYGENLDLYKLAHMEEESFSEWKKLADRTGLLLMMDENHSVNNTVCVHLIDHHLVHHHFYLDADQLLQLIDCNEQHYVTIWQAALRYIVKINVSVEVI